MSFSLSAVPNPTPLPNSSAILAPAHAAAQVAPVKAAAVLVPINVELVMRTSSGAEYSFDQNRLSLAQRQRIQELIGNMAGDSVSFELNLTALISQADGNDGDFLSSENADIQELRELVRLALGAEALCWNTYLSDQRGCQSGDQLFATRGIALTDLKIDDKDRLKALNAPNLSTKTAHTDPQKEEILRRYSTGAELTQQTIKMLKRLEAQVKSAPQHDLLKDAQKTSVKATLDRFTHKTTEELQASSIDPDLHNANSVKSGAILLEALYPLDLTGLDHEEKKDAVKKKGEEIEKILLARNPHGDKKQYESFLGFIPNPARLIPYLMSSESQHAGVKKEYAKDIAAAGLDTRKDYHIYGNNKGTGAELFFIQLQKLIANGASDQEIEECVNGSYFQAAFGSLHPHLRAQAQTEMLGIALGLKEVNAHVTLAPNADNKVLCTNFDTEFAREVNRVFP